VETKILVLCTCLPEEKTPARPYVFSDEALAESTADALVRDDWEYRGPVNDEGEPEPWPGDWRRASAAMVEEYGEGAYGGWELTTHWVDIPVPQVLVDLLQLTKRLMKECGDYRMDAAIRACEVLLEVRK
jgi:hypothetical protein